MFALAWKVRELEDLSQHATQLVVDMQTLAEEIQDKHYDFVIGNVAKSLASLRIALFWMKLRDCQNNRELLLCICLC